MREYGTIKTQFWVIGTGMKIIQCGTDHLAVAIYLFSSPSSNMIGLYPVDQYEISRYTNIELARIKPILEKLIELDFIEYDFERNFVWVKKQIKHQVGNSIKIIKGRKLDTRVIKINAILKEYWNIPLARRFYECYSFDYNLKSPDSVFSQNISQDAAGAKAPVAQPQKINPKPQGTYQPPKDFQPTPEMLEWAKKNHPYVDVATETRSFRTFTSRRLISDWNARWQKWIIDNQAYIDSRPAPITAKPTDVGRDLEQEQREAGKSDELREFERMTRRKEIYEDYRKLLDRPGFDNGRVKSFVKDWQEYDAPYWGVDGEYIPNPSLISSKKSSNER